MGNLTKDLRFAGRMFVRNPGFSVIAVLALGIGIGATTVIFSLINGVLLRPLAYKDSDRLALVFAIDPTKPSDHIPASLPDFRIWASENKVFSAVTACTYTRLPLSGGDTPEQVATTDVSSAYFNVLGVNPERGRSFSPEEEVWGNNRVAVISDALWKRRFGSDPTIVGETLSVDGQSYTVVGVMPPGFYDPVTPTDLWRPLSFEPGSPYATRANYSLVVIGRLNRLVGLQNAITDMASICSNIAAQYKENAALSSATVMPLRTALVGDAQGALTILFGSVVFVLLISCANVASLLLARSSVREREIALRAALGASRQRLVRQLLTESTLLAITGGLLGLALAFGGIQFLLGLAPDLLPQVIDIRIDSAVLLFTLVVSLATGLVFGVLPSIREVKLDLHEALKEGGKTTGGRSKRRTRSVLVVVEVALSVVLLAGGGLMLRSFERLRKVDAGFNPSRILTMEIAPSQTQYPHGNQSAQLFRKILDSVRVLPGINSTGLTSRLPLSQTPGWMKQFSIEGRAAAATMHDVPDTLYQLVSPGYFETMGIGLIGGRPFSDSDNESGSRVVVINQTLARSFFPSEDPIGKIIWLGPPEALQSSQQSSGGAKYPKLTIVGVVRDVKQVGLDQTVGATVFAPYLQNDEGTVPMSLVVRTNGDPSSAFLPVKDAVQNVDRNQPVDKVMTMDGVVNASLSQPRLTTALIIAFAAIALTLAVVGLYGFMSYTVAQETREIGIRMALGARREDEISRIVAKGAKLISMGVAFGLIGAFLLTQTMSGLLFETSPSDPLTLGCISVLLVSTALLATLIPAMRATRSDPMVVLRYE